MQSATTIPDLKRAFLIDQIDLLSEPLRLEPGWQSLRRREREDHDLGEDEDDEGELRDSLVEGVLHKVNVIIRHHARSTYSSQTVRYVAERIDQIYTNDDGVGTPGNLNLEIDEEGLLGRNLDLRLDESIAKLPDRWPDEDQRHGPRAGANGQTEEENERYVQLHTQLTHLNELRRQSQEKLERYRYLQRLLQPLGNPQENVQPNLIYINHESFDDTTDDNELERELIRMRELLDKVESGVRTLKRDGPKQRGPDAMVEEFGVADEDADIVKIEKILQGGR
ncbi:MAG: hypothetical protein M1823_001236 [Watsoniomyces obsoletus]|nr:MAG: hypothetical protein M1823_001236 [Watsoniomyces obsoletus]